MGFPIRLILALSLTETLRQSWCEGSLKDSKGFCFVGSIGLFGWGFVSENSR